MKTRTFLIDGMVCSGCNREIVLPSFDRQVRLAEGENIIIFTPEVAGTYSCSCWMGMLRNTITVKAV